MGVCPLGSDEQQRAWAWDSDLQTSVAQTQCCREPRRGGRGLVQESQLRSPNDREGRRILETKEEKGPGKLN